MVSLFLGCAGFVIHEDVRWSMTCFIMIYHGVDLGKKNCPIFVLYDMCTIFHSAPTPKQRGISPFIH